MSGIYISTDTDRENIPTYLTTGIAFEFMDNHVTLPFRDAIACITNWYNITTISKTLNQIRLLST